MNFFPYIIAILTVFIGAGAITVFTVFIYTGPFHLLTLPFNNFELLLFDAGLSMLFFMQHSLMVRIWFKQGLAHLIPSAYIGAVFSMASGIVLLTLIVCWQESSLVIASSTGVWRWVVRGGFFVVLFVQTQALLSLKCVDLFGFYALVKRFDTTSTTGPILMVGAYRWVRHPIYLTAILLLWLYPDMTADRLLLNILFTAWISLGAVWEEQDLVAIHGEAYQNYQRMVPMLIPYRIPRA